jgi:hypothetical protein
MTPELPSKVIMLHLGASDTKGVEWVVQSTGVIEITWGDRFTYELKGLPV